MKHYPIFKKLILVLFFLNIVSAHAEIKINPSYSVVVDQCKNAKSKKHVWVFKQWHLPPSQSTKNLADFSSIKQEKSQTAIYLQLKEWIDEGQLKELFAEGCSGTLDKDSNTVINGWSIGELKKKTSDPVFFTKIVSSVALKLEALYDTKLDTRCGDDLNLIKQNNLAFSDARGNAGYLMRLEQYKNEPKKAKLYLDGVIELYHLKKDASIEEAIKRVWQELKKNIHELFELIEKRNQVVAELIKKSNQSVTAVVFGGVHSKGIVKLLNQNKIGCKVIEPAGYVDDESKLLDDLKKAI